MNTAIIDLLLMLAIGGLAGLVVALHIKMRQFMKEAQSVPALADDLTQAISASKGAISGLQRACKTDGVHLEELLIKTEQARQEMLFILERAEKFALQFERMQPQQSGHTGVDQVPPASIAETPVTQVSAQVPTPQTPVPQVPAQAGSTAFVPPVASSVASGAPVRDATAPERPALQPAQNNYDERYRTSHTPEPLQTTPSAAMPQAMPQSSVEQNVESMPQAVAKPALEQPTNKPYRPASFARVSAYRGADVFTSASQEEHEQELRRALENL